MTGSAGLPWRSREIGIEKQELPQLFLGCQLHGDHLGLFGFFRLSAAEEQANTYGRNKDPFKIFHSFPLPGLV